MVLEGIEVVKIMHENRLHWLLTLMWGHDIGGPGRSFWEFVSAASAIIVEIIVFYEIKFLFLFPILNQFNSPFLNAIPFLIFIFIFLIQRH
jgi:hypothetical protein